jgi:hypothetical protein
MRRDHALGPPGRAGGVDHIGCIFRSRIGQGDRGTGGADLHRGEPRHGRRPAGRDDGQPGACVRNHEREPFGRKPRVEREVSGAGLEDAQDRHDKVRAARGLHAHDVAYPHSRRDERMGKGGGGLIEVAIRERIGGDFGRAGLHCACLRVFGDDGCEGGDDRSRQIGFVETTHPCAFQRRTCYVHCTHTFRSGRRTASVPSHCAFPHGQVRRGRAPLHAERQLAPENRPDRPQFPRLAAHF